MKLKLKFAEIDDYTRIVGLKLESSKIGELKNLR
jgi:hypothetical protein